MRTGPAFGGNVTSLQIIGQTLYVGGEFQNGAGIPSADYLLACDLATGASSTAVIHAAHPFSGSVYALAADSNGTLYAGGGFTNLQDIPAADNVAYLPAGGTWQPMGAGAGPCGCAVTTFVRGLTTVGTDVYVGTDANDVAGIPQADHVARWNGSAWQRRGRRQRRRERVVPDDRLDQRPGQRRLEPLRHRERSRTRTATRAPTTSPSSTAPHGTRSGPTAPATARGAATATRSRSSIASSMRRGASPAPAATPRRGPSPRSR